MSNNTIAQIITDQIIEALENGTIPWKKPWKTELPMNLISKHVYRGINLLMLSMSPYASPYYLTFKQLAYLGGFVKPGSKGFKVVYWKTIESSDEDTEEKKPLLKYYTVFNVEQCDKIPEELFPDQDHEFDSIAACEGILDNVPDMPDFREAPNAFYDINSDIIGLPPRRNFVSAEEFYSTAFHELVHSTGHPERLNRKVLSGSAGMNENYSKEELVAEIGSSFLCAHARISPKTLDNQAGYIANWLSVLKGDKKFIFSASSLAQKAVDYILGNLSATGDNNASIGENHEYS
jgi:antirestriction protein ArdC